MDRWYKWLESRPVYGAFLGHCLWASAPYAWPRWRWTAFLRIVAVALLWGYLPLLVVLGLGLLMAEVFQVAADRSLLFAGSATLLAAFVLSPIVSRVCLMPLAWLSGSKSMALRIQTEMKTSYDTWIETYG